VPLTDFQQEVLVLLSGNRTPEAYLAGGAALHFEPNSKRFSNDLDFFHDSEARVKETFDADKALLNKQSYSVDLISLFPGFIRASISKGSEQTKIEWVHDTAWRFLPVVKDSRVGYRLHPIDLAINKLLALVGRNEPRDFLDIVEVSKSTLALGGILWAAAGKDPGYSPGSLLELLQRRGAYRSEDFKYLDLLEPPDLVAIKKQWQADLGEASNFISSRPAKESGCLYFSSSKNGFVVPDSSLPAEELEGVELHFGRPGGVLPLLRT